ncbi:MAG TPA: type II toxin-antitoxin system RelE/ParE family toxin [Caulobacteraceae bacterium]|jgi:proteic killer suppression protein
MIQSFRNKPLRDFAQDRRDTRRLPAREHAARIGRIINALDAARRPGDMDVPGFVFHPLHGQRGRYAVRISGNWRITFAFDGENAVDVDIEDYH